MTMSDPARWWHSQASYLHYLKMLRRWLEDCEEMTEREVALMWALDDAYDEAKNTDSERMRHRV